MNRKLNQIENDEISRQHEVNNKNENSQIGVRIEKRETIKETTLNTEVNYDTVKRYRHIYLLDEQGQPCDEIWTDQDQSLQDVKEGAQDSQYDSDPQQEKLAKTTKSILYDQKPKLLKDFLSNPIKD